MNILLLTQEYPPDTGWGGIGTYSYNLSRSLARAGHQVHVLASAVFPGETTHSLLDGVFVHRIRRLKFEVPVLRRLVFSFFPWTKHQWEYIFSVTNEIERLIRDYSIEVIESPEIWAEGLLYSLRRSVPIIVKLHTPLFLIHELDHLNRTLDRRAVELTDEVWTRRADRITSASRSLSEITARKYRLDLSQIPVVPESVDADTFHPIGRPPSGPPTILYVGRLEPRKGVFTLADAMPRVLANCPDARFVYVGADMPIDGRSSQAILIERMQAHGVEGHAEFAGRLSAKKIVEYHNQSSVSVFPSLWENCSVACLEGMACGRPVIATDVGGFPEMIDTGVSGLLVPAGDAEALAKSILEVVRNPQQAQKLGINARQRVEERFAADIVARQTLAVYEKTVESWKARGTVR